MPFSDGRAWTDAALDYAHAEVRDYMEAFLAEAFGRYDIDGVELDWIRFTEHLMPGEERELSWCLDEVVAEARRWWAIFCARWRKRASSGGPDCRFATPA